MKLICPDCGHPCKAKREDFGIGAYEYWGARGVHHDWRTVSDCCEAELDAHTLQELEDEFEVARDEAAERRMDERRQGGDELWD